MPFRTRRLVLSLEWPIRLSRVQLGQGSWKSVLGEKRVFLIPKAVSLGIQRARFGAVSVVCHSTPNCRQDGGYDRGVVSILWKIGGGRVPDFRAPDCLLAQHK